MIYEIINPSDAYTIVADDLKVAAVACVLLGRGQYGLEPLEDDGERVPFMLFGSPDAWFQEHFGADLQATMDEVVENRAGELADCLDSCLIGKLASRREYERALELIESEENRAKFRTERHDERRTSLNDIGGRAYQMAKKLREKAANPIVQAPQQVFAG
jgi:hypothetical protein